MSGRIFLLIPRLQLMKVPGAVLVLLTSVMRPTFCPAASPLWFGFGWSLLLLFDILSSTGLFIYISSRHQETADFYCSRKCGADKSSENSQLQSSFAAPLLFLPDTVVSFSLFFFLRQGNSVQHPVGSERTGPDPRRGAKFVPRTLLFDRRRVNNSIRRLEVGVCASGVHACI